jgi:Protein of unknown function (DUF742)
MESQHKVRHRGHPIPPEVPVTGIDSTHFPRPRAAADDHTADDHTMADNHAVAATNHATPGDRPAPLVQPTAISAGRTHGQPELGARAKLRAAMDRAAAVQRSAEALRPEMQDLLLACDTPTALVELAGALNATLAVIDVLVGDLCARGLLSADQVAIAAHHGRHRADA